MNQHQFLYRNTVFYFIIFFAFALWGFWGSYYSRLTDQPTYHNHLHGLLMTLWCLMLIAQAYLIRNNKRKLHRIIGKGSYLLVVLLTISTLRLIHFRLSPAKDALPDIVLSNFALMFNATIVFVIIYCLAIYFRKDALTHARFMLCTIFPLFTPITDRIIYGNFRWLVQYAPTIDRYPIVPVFGFAFANVILIALSIWDWRKNKRLIFPVVLGILLFYHISVLSFHNLIVWKNLTKWFLSLPLS
jgi:hypothetical protein